MDNILEGRLVIPSHYQQDDEFQDGTLGNGYAIAGTSTSAHVEDIGQHERSAENRGPSSSPAGADPWALMLPNSETGYEIERNSNIFGNQNDLLRESSEDMPLSDRFSKSSTEREKILARRKELMIAKARKRFLNKSQSSEEEEEGPKSRSRTTFSY